MQLLFSGAIPGTQDARGVSALLGVLDLETGEVIHRCEYRPESGQMADGQKVQFTGFSFHQDRLYVCSFNEVVVYDWPPTQPVGRIRLPGFNDLHHCLPWRDGLAIANTGLETVDLVSWEGELLERWDLLESEPGARRIDPAVDYGRIADTKPHQRHVNHLFIRDEALWATQLSISAAEQVEPRPGQSDLTGRISMGVGQPHDGVWIQNRLVFTTTNGHLVFADPQPRSVDLSAFAPDLEQLGWCRGVSADPRGDDRVFVAFTTLRRSRFKEFGYWIRWRQQLPASRIVHYDLAAGSELGTWQFHEQPGFVYFQLDVLPERLNL